MRNETVLMPFQAEGVKKIQEFNGRVLLADEMGLGKTIQTISWWRSNPTVRPIVVICPAFVKHNWEKEILLHAKVRPILIEGRKPYKRVPLIQSEVIVINYDILPYWVDYLRSIHPQLVVIDECQYCKSSKAKRTKAVAQLCKAVPHIIATSGTPITNRPAELFPILKILWPDKFSTFWPFAMQYCQPRKKPWGWEFKGASNLDQLHFQLQRCGLIRRRKKDVLKDLPEKTRHTLLLDISNREQYTKAENDFRGWLADQKFDKGRIERAMKVEALSQIGYIKRFAALLKLSKVMEWVDNFLDGTDEKIILFAIHKKIIRRLKRRYTDRAVVIDGSTTPSQRKLRLDLFNKSKKVRVLIGQLQSTSLGWNGTVASTVGIVELGWTPAEMSQAEDRIHRIGQKKKTVVWYFVARKTIEERICRLLEHKQKVVESTLDGKSTGEFSVLDKLILEYKRNERLT